ncbi:MAG: hypothetical protein COB45_11835 [Gammaproteobacteria bacterium]|nr:MAG: hypothetical protein COB45_11835 [Gammaproteobacteria bacterium]
MASLAKVFKFTLAELSVLLEAWFTFLKWDLLISFSQYDHWRSELSRLHNINDSTTIDGVSPLSFEQTEKIKHIIKLSEIAGRFHIRKMNCLRRCISQEKMLKKRGIKTHMHIGVRFEDEKLKAHAWLTLQGKIINDSADISTRYSELKAISEQEILRHLK